MFETRQYRNINVRREKQPPIQRESQSHQRSQDTENADEKDCVAPLDKKPRHVVDLPMFETQLINGCCSPSLAETSTSVMTHRKYFATPIEINLTRTSPSAAIQTIQPSNTTKATEPTQQTACQEPSRNATDECRNENLVKSAVEGSAVHHSETLGSETQSHPACDIVPLVNLQSHEHNRDDRHPLHLANVPRPASDLVQQPTVHPESSFPPMIIKEVHVSKKETQGSSALVDGPLFTLGAPQDAHHDSTSTLEQWTAPREELTDLTEILIPCSKEGQKEDGRTKEIQGSQLPPTPQANAHRLVEKPIKIYKALSNSKPVVQQAAVSSQGTTDQPNVSEISSRPVAASGIARPSEEDLFYLLMHRQRQRKDIETSLLARQKHLETVNGRLSQRNQNYQHQLNASHSDRDKSAAEANIQKAALEDFKTRFQKLKTFVNGLGKDYGALREQADQMKLAQQGLLNENEDIFRDLQSCRTASAASERSVSSIISAVAKVRQNVAPLEQSLLEAKKTLEGESRLLLKEQQRNKRLEKYLLQVANTQNRYSSAIRDEQKEVLNQLKEITTKVTAVEKTTTAEPKPLLLPGLDECVRKLTTIHDVDRVGPADFTKVIDGLTTLSQRLVRGPRLEHTLLINFLLQLFVLSEALR